MSKQDQTLVIIALGVIGYILFSKQVEATLSGVTEATQGAGKGVSDVFTSVGDIASAISSELSKIIQLPSTVVEKSGDVIYNITETAKNESETKKLRAEKERIIAGGEREVKVLDVQSAITKESIRQGKTKQAQASLGLEEARRTTSTKIGLLPPSQISLGTSLDTKIKEPKKSSSKTIDVIKRVIMPLRNPTLVSSFLSKLRG